MTYPTRMPPTPEEAALVLAQNTAAGMLQGRTRNARPVNPKPTPHQRTPEQAGGDGIIAAASYAPIAAVSLGSAITFDSTPFQTCGPYSTYMDVSGGAVRVLTTRWYRFQFLALGNGYTAGDRGWIAVESSGYQEGTAHSDGTLIICCVVDVLETTAPVNVNVSSALLSGTGSGTVQLQLDVKALSGPTS